MYARSRVAERSIQDVVSVICLLNLYTFGAKVAIMEATSIIFFSGSKIKGSVQLVAVINAEINWLRKVKIYDLLRNAV